MRRRRASVPLGSFNPSYHYEMLADHRRVTAFDAAIRQCVGPDTTVLDIGTGSGVLAILAARAGARTVHAIERMEDMRRIAEANFARENTPALRGPVLAIDARDGLPIGSDIDVVVCELLSTWLVTEQQAQACNGVRPFLAPGCRFVPTRMNNYISGVAANLSFCGYHIDQIYYTREMDSTRPVLMTDRVLSHRIDFRSPVDTEIRIDSLVLKTIQSGMVNAVPLESDAVLDEAIIADAGRTLFLPHVYPLDQPLDLTIGDHLPLKIAHTLGGDWPAVKITAEREAADDA